MNRISLKAAIIWISSWFLLPTALGYGAELSISVSTLDITLVSTPSVQLSRNQFGITQVRAENALGNSEPGQPDIPWQLLTVLLPPNADLNSIVLRLEDVKYRILENTCEIEPVPPMATRDDEGNVVLVWPKGRIIEDGRDARIYGTNAFWPAEQVHAAHKGRLHQWQLVELAVPLVQYNPVTGQLRELLKGRIIVEYARLGRGRGPDKTAARFRRERQRVQEIAVNFAAAVQEYESASEAAFSEESSSESPAASADSDLIGTAGIGSGGYVILTTSAIASGSIRLADFVSHKQSLGWTVSVITEAQWGGGTGAAAAINIRNWLRDNYSGLDILYVLLIGNPHPETGDVPMRWYDDGYESVEGGVKGAPTDALYSDLSTADNWDKYWEVLIGRIPYYGTISALDAVLQKTISYENSQQVLWRWNALLPMVPLSDTTPSYQCGEQIRTNLLGPNNIDSTRIYESDYGLTPPPEYLLSNRYPATEWAAQPYGLVAWITHGWQTGATDVITTSNVNQLNNAYPSAVYEGSCQNAWPENSGNLAYRILQNGGITTVAATRNSFYTPGQTNFTTGQSIGTLAYHYASNLAVSRQSCGLALSQAKASLNLYKANATRMVLFGDPSIVVFVDPDFTPPSPNPMTWAAEPWESGPGAITMTAAMAEDNGGTGVEYYFQCVSGGGRSSNWQSSPTYTDTSVTQIHNSYRVKARDLSDYKNETAYSPETPVTISPYPYGGQARAIPGKIQAEYFDVGGQDVTYFDSAAGNSGGQVRLREDVDIASIVDETVGFAVDDIQSGEWLTYTVHSTAGSTSFYARLASSQAGGQILIQLDEELLGTVQVPNTGSLNTWQNVVINGILLPDRQTAVLKLEFAGSGYRLNWFQFASQMPYWGIPSALPGRIEFEDYDTGGQDIAYYDVTPLVNGYGKYRPNEGVEIMNITDGGTAGFAVVADSPEWLEYTCTMGPGFYTMIVRHASSYADQLMTLSGGGQNLATFYLPRTGSWSTWQTTAVPDIYLPGGEEAVLRFKMESSSALLNYAEFIRQYNAADLSRSGRVDMDDFFFLSSQWLGTPEAPSADIAPTGGDGQVDLLDLLALAENWLILQ